MSPMEKQASTFSLDEAPSGHNVKFQFWFWILAVLLIGYVALCTQRRDNKMGADAWEHMRDLRALTLDLWHPGNPTFASDLPSPRYSPLLVAMAILCRKTGVDPYDMLSCEAVINTCLLVLAIWYLLTVFEEQASAASVLFVMISLWGVAPGYANSYALSDLPWHQVNPSAFCFPLVLFSWAILRRMSVRGWNYLGIAALVLLLTISILVHAMTAAFGVMGLVIAAFFAPPGRRRLSIVVVVLLSIAALLLCLEWPWYSFLAAVRSRQDINHFFNPYITALMLEVWCLPAFIGALYTLPLWRRPLVSICLAGAASTLLAGLGAFLLKSPVLARFPMPGMIFLHIPIGILAHQTGIFRLPTWPSRLRSLANSYADKAPLAMLQITLAAGILFGLIPQLLDILKQPFLARPYLTGILHLRNLQQDIRRSYADLLGPIGLRDVVLSDPVTSWMIPAFRGRIVSASNYELFVPDQPARERAVNLFFNADVTEEQRQMIIREYSVSWIVLNPKMLNAPVVRSLTRTTAIVRQTDGLLLMDASAWMAAAPQP